MKQGPRWWLRLAMLLVVTWGPWTVKQAQDTEKKLAAIAMLVSIYERQREDEPEEGWPEGDLHPRQVLLAIGETIGEQCSICRSRHGSEVVRHACE